MFEKFNKKELGVLDYLLQHCEKEFHLREISRSLKVSSSTAKMALDKLIKKGFIKEKKTANLRIFKCDIENIIVRQMKITKNISWIMEKGLIEILKEELNPISIVLFGSFAKGINKEDSDLDILVITNNDRKLKINSIGRYELQVIIIKPEEWSRKGKKEDPFYYEVISSGIPLYGKMPL